MNKYLHCIDLSNKQKCLNICSTGTISSLLTVQLFINDDRPNPMSIDLEKLENCTSSDINGLSSPRILFIYQRAVLKKLTRPLTPEEQKSVRIGELEIEFERARRKYRGAAPSRLSCLYLVEDNFDSRVILQNMFGRGFSNPRVLEVSLLNKMEIMHFDHHWVDLYYEEPKEEYLKNYWASKVYGNSCPSWEYLLEGTIQLANPEQRLEIEEFVRENYPDDYNGIVAARQPYYS